MKKVLIVTGYGGCVDIQAPAIGEAFRKLGYAVDFFAYQSGFQVRRVYQRYDWFNLATFVKPANRCLNRLLLGRCERTRPDLLFVGKGETILPGVIARIRERGIAAVHFSADDSLGRHHPTNRIGNLSEYDRVFCWDRDPARILRGRGLEAFYLPLWAPEVFTPDPAVPKDLPLTFIGQYSRKREEVLGPLVRFGLRIWGNGWGACRSRALKRRHSSEFSREKKLIELYRRSQITVNPHDIQVFETTSFRTFESLACETFVLTEYNPELENLFDVGREIATYRDGADLVEQVRRWRESPEEARAVARAGRQRVDAAHRTSHRIGALVRILRENREAADLPLDADFEHTAPPGPAGRGCVTSGNSCE